MKRLLASVAMLAAITACAQEAEAPPAAETEAAAPALSMESYAGTWNVTLADGTTHVTTNNADGTFARSYPDGTTDTGTWTYAEQRGCWTPEGGEEACYAISLEDDLGSVVLTAADGNTINATRVAAVAPAAPAAE